MPARAIAVDSKLPGANGQAVAVYGMLVLGIPHGSHKGACDTKPAELGDHGVQVSRSKEREGEKSKERDELIGLEARLFQIR